jgi:hypothetical protein
MTPTAITPREMFDNGELMAEDALRAAIANYAALDDRLEPLTEQKEMQRREIEYLLGFNGNKYEYGGFTLVTIAPSNTVSYDAKALDKVLFDAMASGEIVTPQEILACRKESTRTGSMRIARARNG